MRHQVVHNRGHGFSKRFNPAGVYNFTHTYRPAPCLNISTLPGNAGRVGMVMTFTSHKPIHESSVCQRPESSPQTSHPLTHYPIKVVPQHPLITSTSTYSSSFPILFFSHHTHVKWKTRTRGLMVRFTQVSYRWGS